MNHYFTDNRHLAENRKEISFRFWCFNVSFITDNGVFSKDTVDFGTRVLLNTLHNHENELGDYVLDMGCGYGVVGIVTKKTWPEKTVEMVDVNPRAVELSIENAKKNNIEADIHVSNVYDEVNGNNFSDIITNPPIRAGKAVIYKIFKEGYEYLSENGSLWVVIRKQQGAMSAVKKIKEVFGNCDIIHKEKGYFILKAKKTLTI